MTLVQGKDTHSIISQGQLDSILSSRLSSVVTIEEQQISLSIAATQRCGAWALPWMKVSREPKWSREITVNKPLERQVDKSFSRPRICPLSSKI